MNVNSGGMSSPCSLLQGALELALQHATLRRCDVLLRRREEDDVVYVTATSAPSPTVLESWTGLAERASARDDNVVSDSGVVVRSFAVPDYDFAAIVTQQAAGTRPPQELLLSLTRHVSALLEQHARWRYRQPMADALVDIGTQIQAEEQDIDGVLRTVVERTQEVTGTDVCWIALPDDAGQLRLSVAVGARTADFQNLWTGIGAGVGGTALNEARTLFVPDQRHYANGMPNWSHQVLESEGIASLLCAPILDGDRIIGALYVASREATTFGPSLGSVLAALATQAAVAIRNARLYEELVDRNHALETATAVHRTLTQMSLSGVGLQQLVDEIAVIVHREVYLVVNGLASSRVCSSGLVDIERAEGGASAPVVAGAIELGSLCTVGADDLDATGRRVLEHGATVIALELVKQRAALEVEWRFRGELLDELLRAGVEPSTDLRQRADSAGIDVQAPRCVVLIAPHEPSKLPKLLDLIQQTAARDMAPNDLLVARRGDHVALAVRFTDDTRVKAVVTRLQRRAELAAIPSNVGLSAEGVDLASALRQAQACLALTSTTESSVLIDYRQLGPLRFILDAPNISEMRSLVIEQLAPLAERDRTGRGSQLLDTLRAYLDAGGHRVNTAAACHIHISTLKYRLSCIGDVLGTSLSDPQARFRLTLAFEVRDILKSLGPDPLC